MRLFVFSVYATIAALSFMGVGKPAHAQGAPTPGLHSLEMTDDTAEALYKLKSTEAVPDGDESAPSDGMSESPTQRPPQSTETTVDKKNDSGTPNKTPSASVDPNLQSHTLTLIPDDPTPAVTPPPQSTGKTSKNKEVKKEPDPSNESVNQDTSLDHHVFTPTAKLKPWDKRDTLYGLGQNTDKIRAALIVFESEPEYADPQTLIDVAALYAQVGDYKTAARYYYAANLRRAFDSVRFPSTNIPELKGGPWGESVGAWVTNSSTRMQNTLNDVRAWDERIPYRYHPGYTVPERSINTPVPSESDWMDILTKTRADFFKSVSDMSQALGRMGK